MLLSYIPQWIIQNRNVHISVLDYVLCDIDEEYRESCEIDLF